MKSFSCTDDREAYIHMLYLIFHILYFCRRKYFNISHALLKMAHTLNEMFIEQLVMIWN